MSDAFVIQVERAELVQAFHNPVSKAFMGFTRYTMSSEQGHVSWKSNWYKTRTSDCGSLV